VIGPDSGITANGRLHALDPSVKLLGRELPDRRRAHSRRPLLLDGVDRAREERHPDRRPCEQHVQQVIPIPGASGGIAMSTTQPLAYGD
jgi:hypothetical protein